jgi:hypothetical protein
MTNSIGQNLLTVIKDKNLKEVSTNIFESILDTKISDGFFKDIPVISTIFGSYNAATTIQDRLFVRKLLAFLQELKAVPEDKRIDQIIKIEDDQKYKTKVGEKLLHIINKIDDIDKASLVGKFFKAYLENKFDYDNFVRGVLCIDRTPLPELLHFIQGNFDRINLDTDDGASQYVTYGLMEIIIIPPKIKVEPSRTSFDDKLDYKIVDFSAKAYVSNDGKNIREFLK